MKVDEKHTGSWPMEFCTTGSWWGEACFTNLPQLQDPVDRRVLIGLTLSFLYFDPCGIDNWSVCL
jgi:hypothetical protein